ncbi:MAG: type II toxin-antitoxin system VapC family toxin [Spirochaetia bacterium]|jgi:predicted nucleic acid-binding protein|nr:type II toxin-antitoxin system VapC family toxin [Spirochaetia bacterium]
MVYVFDSSFIAALILPDGKNKKTDSIFSRITEDEEIHVPALLWYEMGNILKNLVRRGRFKYQDALGLIPALSALRLTTDLAQGSPYTEKLLRLAQDYALGSYDAAYLELAGRKKASLCSWDEALRKAAARYGIPLV